MSHQKMITIAAEDVHTRVVGTLGEFQHRQQMANNPEYREEVACQERKPTTFQAMFGLPPRTSMRTALSLG